MPNISQINIARIDKAMQRIDEIDIANIAIAFANNICFALEHTEST